MATLRKTNTAGLNLIKQSEGCILKAYPDPGTGGAPWTIGYGHTGPEVKPQLRITQEQAEAYLRADLAKFEKTVANATTVELTDNQFAALVSFTYNCGPANFLSSTLLKRVNAKDFTAAKAEFARWNKAGGKVLTGLTTRRAKEAALFAS